MKFLCRHCDQVKSGTPYRVVSKEETGDILLDMVVCHSCYLQARELGLDGEEMNFHNSRELHHVDYADQ